MGFWEDILDFNKFLSFNIQHIYREDSGMVDGLVNLEATCITSFFSYTSQLSRQLNNGILVIDHKSDLPNFRCM